MYTHCQFVLPADPVFAYSPILRFISSLKINVCGAFLFACRLVENNKKLESPDVGTTIS